MQVGGVSVGPCAAVWVLPKDTRASKEADKEAYWTSKRLRDVVRDLLLFEIQHGREHEYWSRPKLAKLEAWGTP